MGPIDDTPHGTGVLSEIGTVLAREDATVLIDPAPAGAPPESCRFSGLHDLKGFSVTGVSRYGGRGRRLRVVPAFRALGT